MPGVTIPETHLKLKIKCLEGTWRVILPATHPNWVDIARIPHASYREALEAARMWADVIERKALSA
jgi:hypothetical protein